MALTKNVDTYVTVAEANDYISSYYISTHPARVAWEALAVEDKEVYLRNSLAKLENVKYFGEKYNRDEQTLQFPRRAFYKYPQDFKFSYRYNYHPYRKSVFTYNYIDEEIFPIEILNAQIEEALALSNITVSQEQDIAQRKSLQNQGVRSFRLSKLSETYDINKSRGALNDFISPKAVEYLRKYIVRSALV